MNPDEVYKNPDIIKIKKYVIYNLCYNLSIVVKK